MRTLLTIPNRLNKLFVMVAALVLAVSAQAQNFTTNGVLLYNFWGPNLNNASVGALQSGLLGAPSLSYYISVMEGTNSGSMNNFVDQQIGVFIPPITTNYVFWLSSDDDSVLFLSTDITPAHKKMICQVTSWDNNREWTSSGGGSSLALKRSDKFVAAGANAPQYPNGIPLTAGQKYYIELDHHQGGGGFSSTATYTYFGAAPPVNGTVTSISNNTIAYVVQAPTFLTFSKNPSNATVYAYREASFNVGVNSDETPYPTLYQWYKNGVPITNADGTVGGGPTYSFIAAPADNTATFSCVVSFPNGITNTATSALATLTVLPSNIVTNGVKREFFSGQNVGGLVSGNVPKPDSVSLLPTLEGSINDNLVNYAERISGFFIPPVTTNYVFFTCSDDDNDLFLSTDANPANKTLIASENNWSNSRIWTTNNGGLTQSAPSNFAQKRSDTWTNSAGVTVFSNGIPLVQGQLYYIELIHHQGGGGDNSAATYKFVGDVDPTNGAAPLFAVTNNNIAYASSPVTNLAITANPFDTAVFEGNSATFSVTAATDSEFQPLYQWTMDGTNVVGATAALLKFPAVLADNGVAMRCIVSLPNSPLVRTSSVAHLTVQQAVQVNGFLKREFWSAQNRTAVESGNIPDPDYISALYNAEGPVNDGLANYANRISGFFIPTVTTNYVFWICSDDDSDLFISTDANPAHKRLIAQETNWNNSRQWTTSAGGSSLTQKHSDTFSPDGGLTTPFSAGIPLTNGVKYYIEGVHHQGGGGDNFAFTYTFLTAPAPASGTAPAFTASQIAMLSTVSHVWLTNQPVNQTALSGTTATFTVLGGSDATISINDVTNIFVSYQWLENGTNIPNAHGSSYTTPILTTNDNGAQFSCAITAIGAGVTNTPAATLTVNEDTAPPTILFATANLDTPYALNVTNQYIDVTFSKLMDLSSLTNPANYSVSGGTITAVNAFTNNAGAQSLTRVVLTMSAPVTGPFTVTVNNVRSFSLIPIAPSSTFNGSADPLTSLDIGPNGLGIDPVLPGFTFRSGANSYDITASGDDIWSTGDGFRFAYETRTNNFDIVVQVTSLEAANQWTKVGLMVRELDPVADVAAGQSREFADITTAAAGQTTLDGSAPQNSISVVERTFQGVAANQPPNYVGDSAYQPSYPNVWLRLTRQHSGTTNDTYTAYYGTDGAHWNQLATYDATQTNVYSGFPDVVYVGLATTAHIGLTATPQYTATAHYANFGDYIARPILVATNSAGNLIISWSPAGGNLYSSPTLGSGAVWTLVGTANPSAPIPITGSSKFFQIRP